MKHINVALFVPHAGCPHTCSFCNQKTISGKVKELSIFDIKAAVETAIKGEYDSSNSEIAFFGGSFTAIDYDYMVSLLECAYSYVKQGLFKGIRCSTRPDCISKEILSVLKKYGVTAIELGAQSMDDEVLTLNNRGHSAKDVEAASNLIKEYGFELGLQMMTGLYGDSAEKCIATAEKIISLKPDTVRIYPTVVLENTCLELLYKSGKYKPQTLNEAVEICAQLLKMFHKNNIFVIRLGLHSGGNVEDDYVAGAYHPALRELCESRIYYGLMEEYIKTHNIKGKTTLRVCPTEISKVIGQKRSNIELLRKNGIEVKVIGDASVAKYCLSFDREE